MNTLDLLKEGYRIFRSTLNSLKEQSQIHASVAKYSATSLYDTVHRESAPVFVLSTGRCGTKLLTELFDELPAVKAWHEPSPELTYYSRYAFEHSTGKDEAEILTKVIDAARYEFIRNAFLMDKVYVETNNRITFYAFALARLYPHSRFIHLVRKPEKVVKSGLARDWYTGKTLYDESRPQPPAPIEDRTAQIAWLWNETNNFIETFKESAAAGRFITVRSEDLFSDPEVFNRILKFLDLDPLPTGTITKKINTPVNSQDTSKVDSNRITRALLQKYAPLRAHYYSEEE